MTIIVEIHRFMEQSLRREFENQEQAIEWIIKNPGQYEHISDIEMYVEPEYINVKKLVNEFKSK